MSENGLPQQHTSFNRATPPYPSQTVPPTTTKLSHIWTYGDHFHSNNQNKVVLFCFVFKLLVRGWRDGSGIDRVLYVSRWAFYCFNETHFHITVIMEGSQSRNLEAETDAMKCCLLKCLPLMAYSTCFLMRPQDHLWGMAPPTISWALPHQSKIKKMHNRYAYRQILWRHFPNWNFLFPNDYLVSSWHKTSRHTALAKDLSSIPVTLIR